MAKVEKLEKEVDELRKRLRKLEGATGTTHIGIVQDRSGSMSSLTHSTIDGFNEYVNGLRKGAKEDERLDYRLTLVQFDDEIITRYEDLELKNVKDLNTDTYQTRGVTALYDAIGTTIEQIESYVKDGDDAIIVIMTDGYENASQKFNKDRIKSMVKDKEKRDWQFVFLGAGIDAMAEGAGIGIAKGNTMSYGKTAGATRGTYYNLSAATNARTSAVKSGTYSAASMDFVTDFMPEKIDEDDDGGGSTNGG